MAKTSFTEFLNDNHFYKYDFSMEDLENLLSEIEETYNIKYEEIQEGHKSYNLQDKSAIYIFNYKPDNIVLKIGKVGPESGARLNYQHYNMNSCKSNLAKQLDKTKCFFNELSNYDKDWIKKNCDRYVIFYKNINHYELHLVESILQNRYKPIYEEINIKNYNPLEL